MQVRIYQPPKNAMQSGRANTKQWLVEFEPESAREIDPLMGWTSSRDTQGQLRMWFETKEEAVAYAQRQGVMYTVEEPRERKTVPKGYGDNFSTTRLGRWTH
ncbi:ETC complex I subunit [Kiloniella laminariae]|uniref:ETC complex I subunit n=1 Tax=Kiloniella laminariae TaxID=454162 RepID=A0ABT4LNK4_9PROT|nr:ETC complex I subunit [Kiloniella laminariae]MCZ4282699.1 ETC complex I subunit [Kiloniella laminariae]